MILKSLVKWLGSLRASEASCLPPGGESTRAQSETHRAALVALFVLCFVIPVVAFVPVGQVPHPLSTVAVNQAYILGWIWGAGALARSRKSNVGLLLLTWGASAYYVTIYFVIGYRLY